MYRTSNKQLSGQHAHLNGKSLSWQQNFTYADPQSTWIRETGKIIRVGSDGKSFYVENMTDCARHWVDPKWEQYRNIEVESPEADKTMTTQMPVEENPTTPQPSYLKFSVQQNILLKGLELVSKSVAKRAVLPILQHIRIQAHETCITLSSSDLDTGIVLTLDAQVERQGVWTLPAKVLLDLVKSFPKNQPVQFETGDDRLWLSCGKRTFTLECGTNGEVFPVLPESLPEGPCTLPCDDLCQGIKETAFAAAGDDSRPVFISVCLHLQADRAHLVACDGFRMALRSLPLPADDQRDVMLLVPAPAMRLLAEIMPANTPVDITWSLEKKQARVIFQCGQVRFASKLIEGTFPNYMAAFPKEYKTTFTLERSALMQILSAFRPFTRDSSNILRIFYQGSSVVFEAKAEDLGAARDELEVEITGDDGSTILNEKYLSDFLKAVQTDTYTLQLVRYGHPCVFLPYGRDDYQYVLMPMSPDK